MSESTTESDGIPSWQGFMVPILQVLSDSKPHQRRDIVSGALERAKITSEQRSILLRSGQSKAENRVAWALTHLTQAQIISRPARATFTITDAGRELLVKSGDSSDGSRLYLASEVSRLNTTGRVLSEQEKSLATSAEDRLSPLEHIEAGINLIHAEVGSELLTRLRESHPDFFEQAVVDLLLKMGYGGAEQRGKRIGGSGDGGVDGVIDQDALGLDQIYVQAKRYREGSNIGRETIQAFVGALHGTGASRGVFITTSGFTENARRYANDIPSRVILIDSQRLVALMIKYRIGVQVKESYHVVALDDDFFD